MRINTFENILDRFLNQLVLTALVSFCDTLNILYGFIIKNTFRQTQINKLLIQRDIINVESDRVLKNKLQSGHHWMHLIVVKPSAVEQFRYFSRLFYEY